MRLLDPLLALDGAILTFRIADFADGLPADGRLEITDDDAAALWLPALVGDDAVAGVLERGVVRVAAPSSMAALAWALWARRWWPTSPSTHVPALDAAQLAIEAAALTAEVEREVDGALDAFEADAEELLLGAEALLAANGTDATHADAVDGLLDALEDDHEHAVARVRSRLRASARRRDLALAAGARSSLAAPAIVEGTASVDWSAVPPGVVDAAEGTVRWSVVATSPATLVVDVRLVGHRPLADLDEALEADVGGLVVELSALGTIAHGERSIDDAAVDRLLAGPVEVRVATRGALPSPPTSVDEREDARRVVRERARGAHRLLAESSAWDDEY